MWPSMLASFAWPLVNNIFVKFGGCLWCFVRLLKSLWEQIALHRWLTLFLLSYEFLDSLVISGHMRFTGLFNLCCRCIDDLIVFNNKTFSDYDKEIYPT